jgi:ribosomal-protein-alanine N-acetyltransferase
MLVIGSMTTIRSAEFSDIDMLDGLCITRARAEHLSAIAAIERECFGDPRTEESLQILIDGRAMGLVALCDGKVAGYVGMLCVLDEGQIINVAVSSDFRRRGIGAALMNELERYSRENGIVYLSLEVRESNLAARNLYIANGYVERGLRKGFYSKPLESAVVMTKELL